MRELFGQAAKITNNNIILAVPLIIFIKILDLYSLFSMVHVDSFVKLLLAMVTVLFMCGVFASGWFYMIKGAVKLSNKVFVLDSDRANASLNLFKCIPEGIGKYFLSFVGAYIILFLFQFLATPLVFLLGKNLIGDIDPMLSQQITALLSTPNADMTALVESLTPEQLMFFGKWSLFFMLATSVILYLLMLWVPEIIYKKSHPLEALYLSIKKLFKDFFNTLRLFLSLWFMGFALLFGYTFAIVNPIAYLLVSIIIYYFTVYSVVLIFLYYSKTFVDGYEK